MNERIKELADQIEEMYKLPSERELAIEKFAELIVRECDRYVAEHYDECEPWMEPGDLLKHFGVE